MSKDVVIAGVIVAACLGLVTVAFVVPKHKTVTPEIAATLRASGVTRVSMGAQSFQPRLLQALERHHDPASVVRAVRHLREAGDMNGAICSDGSTPQQVLERVRSAPSMAGLNLAAVNAKVAQGDAAAGAGHATRAGRTARR